MGTHSAAANRMVRRLLEGRLLGGALPPYSAVQAEVKYGAGGKSRVDFLLSGGGGASAGTAEGSTADDDGTATVHLEVKSVTLAEDLPADNGTADDGTVNGTADSNGTACDGGTAAGAAAAPARIALFPDTVSLRALRHAEELTALAAAGRGAALVFLVQRGCVAVGAHAEACPLSLVALLPGLFLGLFTGRLPRPCYCRCG